MPELGSDFFGRAAWLRRSRTAGNFAVMISPISEDVRGRAGEIAAALAARGLPPGRAALAGVRAGPGGTLLIPVRDEEGRIRAVRRYAGAAPGARALDDDGASGVAPAGSLARTWDGRVFDVTPHIAWPGGRAGGRARDAVFIVEDEVAAEIAASRLGVVAVAPGGPAALEEAALAAVRIARGGPVVVALARAPERDADPYLGRSRARLVAAVAAAGGRVRALALGPRDSLERRIALGRPLRLTGARTTGIALREGISPALLALTAAAEALRGRIAAAFSAEAARLARDPTCPRPRRLEEMSGAYRRGIADAAHLEAEAARAGTDLLAIGGLATDLVLGGPLRERKDIDVAYLGGDPALLDRLAARAAQLGYALDVRIPGRMVRLARAGMSIEVFRIEAASRGAELVLQHQRVRLPPAAVAPEAREIGPLRLRPLRPDLVLALKEVRLRDLITCFPRHERAAAEGTILDTAALRARLGSGRDPLGPVRRGEVRVVLTRPDAVALVRAQLGEARRALARRRQAACNLRKGRTTL